MASHGISYTLNDQMFDRLLAEQRRRGKTGMSPDLFAKELLSGYLDPDGELGKQE